MKRSRTTFTIRGLSRSCLAKLGKMASAEKRSLNHQIIHVLEEASRGRLPIYCDPVRQVAAWHALAGRWAPGVETRAIMTRRSGRRRISLSGF